VITRSVLFSLKCTRNRLAAGLRPDPLGELERSPRPPSRNRGLGPAGREGKGGNGKGGERGGKGREGKKREGKRKGGERKGRKSSSPNVKLAVDATVHS